ncbi:probable pleckstrin homology domain-containing family N member 1 [Oncorhynchus tshawytscha]|uniref:probable pleckstrin homology domain-containing family N member 1 n=1 Tax=Oncorhynchus tshawytscha TaxID=74940 RepID=UPI000D0A5DFC|nr:probable pleckstrin homology domain-containing family N member 1 [Oncorhynchus tshawytscha]
MGCCSVTQRGAHSGIDDVGPDEIELLEIDNSGIWSLGESRLQLSVRNGKDGPPSRYPSVRHLNQEVVLWGRSREELHHRIYNQPIRDWEGQPTHMYGEIVHSSLVSLHNSYTQETREHYLVLFSFHLLILSLDHSHHDFIYEGMLPLSGLSFQATSLASNSQTMFQISGPMVDSKVFTCASAAEMNKWIHHMEERKYKSMSQLLSPSHCALSYLVPCDEIWKKEELKTYLLQVPIQQWEGAPIQHMGQPVYISMVHIINTQRQGLHQQLLVLFPQDVLLLSVDNKSLSVIYEGRLPRKSITAVERSALPGRLEFELAGELIEPLQVSCTCPEEYQNWIFQLQQPEKNLQATSNHPAPPLMPKKQRSRKESQEPMIIAH